MDTAPADSPDAQTAELTALLENPRIFGIHKLPPRAAGWPARRDTIQPEQLLYDIDDWRINLGGFWKFHWSPDLGGRPRGFYRNDFDDSGWSSIRLPADFECAGYGTPIYSNITYPFRADPPRVMGEPPPEWTSFKERNPTGSCRRMFTPPPEWADRETILWFGGVQSAFRLWVNGEFAGYSEDSMGSSEFDVTALLRPGANLLAVQVYKYASGSYLEDQDFWRLSGIFRDVFAYSRHRKHLSDAVISADPATGIIRAAVESSAPDARLEIEVAGESAEVRLGPDGSGAAQLRPLNFRLWSPEQPNLYPVRLRLKGEAGEGFDTRFFRTGFRSVAIRDRVFRFNGKPVKLHGVNRHEFDPERGRAVTPAGMERDIRLIKAAHFDAVRSSHYPNDPRWYELCDRAGLWVLDEANIESHGLSYHRCVLPGDDPDWEPAVLDRIERMVRTNRNHVSITIWSPGNEAGYGNAFTRAAERIRELDPRPIQYADMNAPADFDSQTYPPPAWLEEYVKGDAERKGEHGEIPHLRQHGPGPGRKPFLMNEYAHAMGNSTGNFAEYWQTIERHPCLAGGFLWEWCEHGFRKTAPGGQSFFAYGGDFGDMPNDRNFCCDGLVRADRTLNPGWFEVRFMQQPLAAERTEHGRLRIFNKFNDTGFDRFQLEWELLRNGSGIVSGRFDAAPGPGEAVELDPPCPVPESGECFWRIRLGNDGETIAETEVPCREAVRHHVLPAANPLWIPAEHDLAPASSELPGLAAPPEAVLDRVPTDNDNGCRFPERTAQRRPGQLETTLEWSAAGNVREVKLTLDAAPDAPEIARLGIRLLLRPDAVRQIRWYGRGPHESYCDRKRSALVGRYEAPGGALCVSYTRPQENGQRTDTRELELESGGGKIIRITSPALFGFTLRPYRSDTLAAARHTFELVPETVWELTLDHAQRGVGGDDSWGCDVHDEYRLIPRGRLEARFRFELV